MDSKTFSTASLTALALIAFAANSIFCRLALAAWAIDPASYTAIRLIAGALTLWFIARWRCAPPAQERRGGWFAAAALFLYAAAFSFAYVSLSAGTGALILFASVQITMIGAGLYSGERPRPAEWIGLIVALGGLVYLVSPGITAPSPLGSALMAVAGIAWGVYSLLGRGVEPVRATADSFLRAALLALACLAWLPALDISLPGLIWAVLSGSISSALGYVVWYAALRGLSATRAATVQLAVPVLAALGGVLFLSEALTLHLTISAAIILGGVGLALMTRKAPAKSKHESRTGELAALAEGRTV